MSAIGLRGAFASVGRGEWNKVFRAIALLSWATVIGAVILGDAIGLLSRDLSRHTVVGYGDWLHQPVTNLMVGLTGSREYETCNATHTERWRVREAVINGVEFWRLLERRPVGQGECPIKGA